MRSFSRRLISTISQSSRSNSKTHAASSGAATALSIIESQRRTVSFRGPANAFVDKSDSLYEHTSGRWLWHEAAQQSCRRIKFDASELANACASATGSGRCVSLKKLSEGSFNKAFFLTMDNGNEIVAKLPNTNAGYRHFTTASEVATMDYVRNVLGIPVPQVYAWNSSLDNTVGAEYILMEKCRGVELHKVWDDITDLQKSSLVQKIVSYEAAFSSAKFPMYGALYYSRDLVDVREEQLVPPAEPMNGCTSGPFAIGPTTDRAFFDHGREDAARCRGPWSTLYDYNVSAVERELACIRRSSQFPDPQGFFNGPGQYKQSAEAKSRTLNNFLRVIKYMEPKDPVLSKPIIWHTDLHAHNIFVDEQDPTKITAIIDWQAVHLAPLFEQARHPAFLEFEGDIPKGFDPSTITLPENYDNLNEEEQRAARRLRGAQILWKLYEIELDCQYDEINRAIRFSKGLIGRSHSFAGNVFSDGELLLEDLLIQLQQEWSKIVDDVRADPCPLTFTEQDIAEHEIQFTSWVKSVKVMTEFLDNIGGYRGWDGSVSHEQFEAGKEHMKRFKEEFLARHSSTKTERQQLIDAWPFND